MFQFFYPHIYVTIFILSCAFLSKETVTSDNLPLWSWECIDGKCVPSQIVDPGQIQSLPTCNMICASTQIWPYPTGSINIIPKALAVRARLFKLKIVSSTSSNVEDHLKSAFQLFVKDLSNMENEIGGILDWQPVAVSLFVKEDDDIRMLINTDESYSLWLRTEVEGSTNVIADVTAKSFCGALRGLETLKQIIWWDPYINSLQILEGAMIEDAPKFRYRGLMLDTSENFFPVPDLIRTIDAMAVNKLNTFHWHLSDSQAISLFFSNVPRLELDDEHLFDVTYSTKDVRTIVTHARLRGIRVLMELDTPAHASHAWEDWGSTKDISELVLCLKSSTGIPYCDDPPCGQLNPKNPYVFELLELIYSEFLRLTGVDDIFHIGGDGINLQCWKDNVQGTDPVELWLEYTKQAIRKLQIANKRLPNMTLLWSSVNATELIKTELKEFVCNIAFQTRSVQWTAKYVSGIRTIVSHENAWDLNSGFGIWNRGGHLYNSWKQVYEHRPWIGKGDCELIEGGEVTVWSKNLNPEGLDGIVWPRAAAFAERVWSDLADGSIRLVEERLDVHRSRLVSHGIKAAPIRSMWCTQNPFTCD